MEPLPAPRFHLGCPAWSVPSWKGNFLPAKTKPADFLEHYARVFSSVEGNSTFYALPSLETARRWASQVPSHFQFCFKVPRSISHGEGLLANSSGHLDFLEFLEVFAEAGVLGPSFLQLHQSFGPSRLKELDQFCQAWPQIFPFAIEVRHPAFFQSGKEENELQNLLSSQDMDRVIFDSGALYQSPPDDPIEAVSQTRKPNLPVRWEVAGQRPFLRLVGRNQSQKADPWLQAAAKVAAEWIADGRHPYLFMHSPDDTFAPTLAERFHRFLEAEVPGLPPLDLSPASEEDQLSLFDRPITGDTG
ncbi:MAG: DUF72 domain-containing protein [Verrucomicrobiota bacterium]